MRPQGLSFRQRFLVRAGLGIALATCWLLITSTVALAAAGGEAYTGQSQLIGRGVVVSVADLMAAEARRVASEPPSTGEPKPTKPEYEFLIERRRGLRNDPASPLVSAFPDDSVDRQGFLPSSPQAVGTSVLGVTSSEAGGFVPPDSHGAAGDTQFVVAANVFMRSFSKATGAADGVLALSLGTFFAPVSGGAGLSDPRVKFDPLSRRWFVSIITTSTTNRILLAVSSGANITSSSSFTFFSFAATDGGGAESQTPFADYDTLGIDAKGVYFGLNMFNTSGTAFLGSTIFVINKPALLASTPTLILTAFRQLNNGTGPGMYTPYVADNADPAATAAYAVGVDNVSFGTMVIRRITGADTATPAISANLNVTVPATAAPLNVTVLGRTQAALDALDDRLFEAKVANGRLWTAHNIQVNASGAASSTGGRTGSRWYEFGNLDATPVLEQSGTLFSSATTNPDSYWIPSIGITGQGHAALASSAAGPARFPDIAFAGRLAGDAPGALRTPTTAVVATNSYTVTANRWGDYSHTATDPNDNMTLWTFQQYPPSTTTWGVRAVQLRAPPPAALSAVTPSTASQGQTLNVVVTGTSTAGSGFYNPPPVFPNRLRADFGPGVTVNAVVASAPTSATFNITVGPAAATGARAVTITNPDGQTASSPSAFTVTTGSCPTITIAPASLPNLVAGVLYSQALSASPAGTYTYSIVGSLPPGLVLAGDTITGTPTTAGSYSYTAVATSGACSGTRGYTQTVGTVNLVYSSSAVTTGNTVLDPNECNAISVTIGNNGTADATAVSGTLSTTTPGASVFAATSGYPNISAPSGSAANSTPFQLSTTAGIACGSQVDLQLNATYQGGTVSLPFSLRVGGSGTVGVENFDGVTAPALPAGWTTQQTGTPPSAFATTTTGADSAPNAAFTNGATAISTNSLVSAPITLPATGPGAQISFRHAWNFESATGSFDGGVLELSTDGGTTFNDVTSAGVGGSFTAGGYTGTINSSFSNPLGGRAAWVRVQAGYVGTTLQLPASLNGQQIRLRFRAGFDSSTAAANPNWRIDTITLGGVFNCTPGTGVCSNPPTQLAIGTQPTSTVAGAAITPAVTVRLLDAQGALTNAATDVTLAIAANPGSGTLSGTTTVTSVNGVATFGNLSINAAGTGYTLAASSGSLTGTTTNAFNITAGTPAQLAFGQQPSNANTGASITPAVTVRTLDALGNLTTFSGNVGMAIGTNPGGGSLAGTTTVAAAAGIASFANLSIGLPGVGYTLVASSPGLTNATSTAFTISAAAPQFAYVPTPGSLVIAGPGAVGTTPPLIITPSVAVTGAGTGPAATTQVTCTPPTAPFAGFTATPAATGTGAITGGALSGTCLVGANNATTTLNCIENRGGTNVPRAWTLLCPSGVDPVFANGFEAATVAAPQGVLALETALVAAAPVGASVRVGALTDMHGLAAVVYARLGDAGIEVAVARPDEQGMWRASAWQAIGPENAVAWVARQEGGGWRLVDVAVH